MATEPLWTSEVCGHVGGFNTEHIYHLVILQANRYFEIYEYQMTTHLTPCPRCSPMTTCTTSLYLSNPAAVEEEKGQCAMQGQHYFATGLQEG